MVDLRESNDALGRRERGQDSYEGGRRSSSLNRERELRNGEQIAEALAHIAELAEAQQKRSRSFTSAYSSSITVPGSLFPNLHLPEESAIASALIENYSTLATLTIYEGPGASGRIIAFVTPSHWKRIALGDHISSISVVASVVDPAAAALVVVTLSTKPWAPQTGTLL